MPPPLPRCSICAVCRFRLRRRRRGRPGSASPNRMLCSRAFSAAAYTSSGLMVLLIRHSSNATCCWVCCNCWLLSIPFDSCRERLQEENSQLVLQLIWRAVRLYNQSNVLSLVPHKLSCSRDGCGMQQQLVFGALSVTGQGSVANFSGATVACRRTRPVRFSSIIKEAFELA